ncbi:DEAD/DEAH box helicase [Glycomyces artemisiae]|uniref:Putative helicase n=1 Tax=Glycomyces artemisiae TaxID=1076443 RepID=A0A2T0UCX0_9ACTN|nr:type ISP restriction/modification enzyme [Glycomyces artemisiae]PRY55734.1 putative helicase [Glycomyces artemisiae]
MTGSVRDILDHIRVASQTNAERGRRFEQLMLAFFRTDPQWRQQFAEVWMWADSPLAEDNATDTGIDLVAREAESEEFCAIQCKFYEPDKMIRKADIDSFFTASGKKGINRRIIVSSTDKWGPNAEAALADQQVEVTRVGMSQLDTSPIDWSKVAYEHAWVAGERLGPRYLRAKKAPMPHQDEAIEAVLAGFETHDRGRLTMACGTGKTLTSLKIAERLASAHEDPISVLVLVPSIALLAQTMREWVTEAEAALRPFAVCSDPKVSKQSKLSDSGDQAVHDLALPATTNASKLADRIRGGDYGPGMTAVFCTYQSLPVIADAQASGLDAFDLVVCDEAHRTTGAVLTGRDESNFTRIHDPQYIVAERRLYMTATPRIFTEPAKADAQRASVELCSMDDEARFGPEFHELGFGKAVEAGLLADYKVLVLSVDAGYAAKTLQVELADDNMELNVADAAKLIGVWNGLRKRLGPSIEESGFRANEAPMRRAVAFARNIAASKHLTEVFSQVTERLGGTSEDSLRCEVGHVDGTMNALERGRALEWLKSEPGEGTARILSNARCLSEGVDVPALDAVLFLHPRKSVIDIVQAVGRVMRRAHGKEYGYIILPVAVPEGVPPNEALDDNERYRAVWQVLNALRSHDDRFNAEVNRIGLNRSRSERILAGHIAADHDPSDLGGLMQAARSGMASVDEWRDAIYARIVQKVGTKVYWKEWAKDIADIAGAHMARIRTALELPGKQAVFDAFVAALRSNLNPSIAEHDAIEMLAQHLITKPVFDALFEQYEFAEHNPVSKAMEMMLEALDDQASDTERDRLKRFYEQIRVRIEGINNPEGRQKVLLELYEQFFKNAMPQVSDRLGIVYTPVEIVDFMLHLTDQAMRRHLGASLSDEGVQVIDPFAGTGTFPVRLLQSELIRSEDLVRKYRSELHVNEIVLLAYYIAAVNIEEAFHSRSAEVSYRSFDNIVLLDSLQTYEREPEDSSTILAGNIKRAVRQQLEQIIACIANPPYSVGQDSQNDGNQNMKYPRLDQRIRETYAARSTATNKNSLYDSYVRALRWASDRIEDHGVICFVLNNGFIDGNTAAGLRLTLMEEFNVVYCFNLRGNARTAGEQRRAEAGNVFGSSSRTGIAILLLIKSSNAVEGEACRLYYRDIGEYHDRKRKLEIVANGTDLVRAKGLDALGWQQLDPEADGDWINVRDKRFQSFRALGRTVGSGEVVDPPIFRVRSRGLSTGRDAWVYNFSNALVIGNVQSMIDFYNNQVERLEASSDSSATKISATEADGDLFVSDGSRFSWNRADRGRLLRRKRLRFDEHRIFEATYRPFTKQRVYLTADTSDCVYQLERLFPDPGLSNVGFYTVGAGSAVPFSVLATDAVPNLHVTGAGSGGQFFPRFTYHKNAIGGTLFDQDPPRYTREENISDAVLTDYRETYRDGSISKDDIFHYIYGILHSPSYRSEFEADLRKSLPRIPKVAQFHEFARSGNRLMRLHLAYEAVEPYPGIREIVGETKTTDPAELYRVDRKMRFASREDRTRIVYNSHVTLTDIPEAAFRYQVGSRSAVEWIMDRYYVRTDKASGIVNDPNDWSDDPRYIIDLLKRIVTVSLETMAIVDALPPLETMPDQ